MANFSDAYALTSAHEGGYVNDPVDRGGETYRGIARRYFPNATIVADRFHVIRLINQHFLKVWQQVHPEGRKNRGLLSLMRRHQWRLKDEQHANLMTYLADYPVLQALYVAKQKLVRFIKWSWTEPTAKSSPCYSTTPACPPRRSPSGSICRNPLAGDVSSGWRRQALSSAGWPCWTSDCWA